MRGFYFISFCCLLMLTNCTSVTRMNNYSTSALKTLKKYEELGYTFDKACREKCYLQQVKKMSLRGNDCNCQPDQTADSVTNVLYNAIKGYFDGMVKLSGDDVTTYKTQALTKELKSGKFGDLKIEKAEVDAYAKLSTLLLKAFTDGYR